MSRAQHLLLMSLGPVQDFIATARRCQDLWFGSWLLSDLSRAAAAAIRGAGGTTLVFPAALGNDKVAVANKILVMTGGAEPATVAAEGEAALKRRLEQIRDVAFARLRGDPLFKRDIAKSQLDELIEVVWVATPMSSDAVYPSARERAETLLAARKCTRTWRSVPWGERAGVPKCSLDGVRESVLDEKLYDTIPLPRRRTRYGVKGSERLCGVALLKRLGSEIPPQRELSVLRETQEMDLDEDELEVRDARGVAFEDALGGERPVFHSTSHTAVAPLFTRIAQRKKLRELDVYFDLLHDLGLNLRRFAVFAGDRATAGDVRRPWPVGDASDVAPPSIPRVLPSRNGRGWGYDGVLLYESRLAEHFEQYGRPARGSGVSRGEREAWVKKQAAAAREGLHQLLSKDLGLPSGPTRPSAYYALLLADGDHMGRAIDRLRDFPRHRELSRALEEEFARGCGDVVGRHGGSLIYAGGDDVLALLPLHTALDCARRLRETFREVVSGCRHGESALFPVKDDAGELTPTLSVGIAVVHHLDALTAARKLAHDANQLAKSRGRNALALVVSKRGGTTLEAVGNWDEEPALDERLKRWGELLAGGRKRDAAAALPDGIAFHLEEAVAPFVTDAGGDPGVSTEVIAALVKRVFSRARAGGTTPLDSSGAAMKLLSARFGFGPDPAARTKQLSPAEALAEVRALSAEIQIARTFLTAWDDAWEVMP